MTILKDVRDVNGNKVAFKSYIEGTYSGKTGETLASVLSKTTLVKIPVAWFPDFITNPKSVAAIVGSTDPEAVNNYCKAILASVSGDSKFFVFASKSDGGATSPITYSNGDVASDITLELYGASFTYYDFASKKHFLFSGSFKIIENEGNYTITSDFTKDELKSDDIYRFNKLTNTLSDESTSAEIVSCIGDFDALIAAIQATKVFVTNDEDDVIPVNARAYYSSDNDNYEVTLAVQATSVAYINVYTITGTGNTDLVCKVKDITLLSIGDIVDNLNSAAKNKPVSANQVRILNEKIEQKIYYVEGIQALTNTSTKDQINSVISSWADLVKAVENGAIIKNLPTFDDEVQFEFAYHKEGEPNPTEIFLSDIHNSREYRFVISSPDNGNTLSIQVSTVEIPENPLVAVSLEDDSQGYFLEIHHANGDADPIRLQNVVVIPNADALVNKESTSDQIKAVFNAVGGWDNFYNVLTAKKSALYLEIASNIIPVQYVPATDGSIHQVGLASAGWTDDLGSIPYMAFRIVILRTIATDTYQIEGYEEYNPLFQQDVRDELYLDEKDKPLSARMGMILNGLSIPVAEFNEALQNGFTQANIIGVTSPTPAQINSYCLALFNKADSLHRSFRFESTNAGMGGLFVLGYSHFLKDISARQLELAGMTCLHISDTNELMMYSGSFKIGLSGSTWTMDVNLKPLFASFTIV